jgi:hypothetical protein
VEVKTDPNTELNAELNAELKPATLYGYDAESNAP